MTDQIPTRSCTFLDQSGDISIAWTPEQDALMVDLIRKKMQEGYSFFVIKPGIAGYLFRQKREIGSVLEIGERREVFVQDEDVRKMSTELGLLVGSAKGMTADVQTIGRTADPEVAAKSETVATRPMRAG